MSSWPSRRESTRRLRQSGIETLADAEVLALFMHGARREDPLARAATLLAGTGGREGLAAALTTETNVALGISETFRLSLLAALEYGRRCAFGAEGRPAHIRHPDDALPHLRRAIGHLDHEAVCVLVLDVKNQLLAAPILYHGSVSQVSIRIGELFKHAIRIGASAALLGHNHPSGTAEPSREDVQVTTQAVAAGRLLDVEILDHIIVTPGHAYLSLRQQGLGFAAAAADGQAPASVADRRRLYRRAARP